MARNWRTWLEDMLERHRVGGVDPSLTSYRYLRIGMFGLVFLLGTAVAIEVVQAGCFQTSISAYYYTPARAIFVGALVAIGFALIVIKGLTPAQDILLNLAGMMAPVVALVPISGVGECWSTEPEAAPVVNDVLAGWVRSNIDNNILALLITGVVGLTAAAVLIGRHLSRQGQGVWTDGALAGVLLVLGLLGVAAVAFAVWDGFDRAAHYIAAISMFVFLGLVVGNDWWLARRQPRTVFRAVYGAISLLMLAGAIVVGGVLQLAGWAYTLLVLEIIEIVLFAAYWIAQTFEHWGDTPGGVPPTSPGSGTLPEAAASQALDPGEIDLRAAEAAPGASQRT